MYRQATFRCQRRLAFYRSFVSYSPLSYNTPNPPLQLDPSLQSLLRDVDISLTNRQQMVLKPSPRELEAFPIQENGPARSDEVEVGDDHLRRSPAARFGTHGLGAVIIPMELQASISRLVSESDRPQLHNDAKRLFTPKSDLAGSETDWESKYDVRYRSYRQAARHMERDGTAFASIALPAHYSAIFATFNHIKRRTEPDWTVRRVIDWGAGTGSGLWAAMYSFQKGLNDDSAPQDFLISNSTISSYLAVDSREGLVTIGKRLLRGVASDALSVLWQKSFREEDKLKRSDGADTVALSAFMLSTLPMAVDRKNLVKQMWESGAHTMVLIDHNSQAGFEAIATAREYLLKMGSKELSDPETISWPIRGSHVVAPCPHDKPCPLFSPGSTKLICGFSQRLQRPNFVRLTKHSGVGHEDTGYSYVVIRRGPRISSPMSDVGRIGEVGRRSIEKQVSSQTTIKELLLHEEHTAPDHIEGNQAPVLETSGPVTQIMTQTERDAIFRLEAFNWPRLVFPPLKKSGHIILDSCTNEGKIMRLTIPKSQGKQPFYDARKSSWGDIFPHPPKNSPQERVQTVRNKETPVSGSDIGKRRKSRTASNVSYEKLAHDLKESRKRSKRDWRGD